MFFSSCQFPQRRRRASTNEEAIFMFLQKDASCPADIHLGETITEHIEPSLAIQAQCSLQGTLEEVREHPADAGNLTRARARTGSDLSSYAAKATVSRSASPPIDECEAPASHCVAPQVPDPMNFPDHEECIRAVYESQGLDFDAVRGQASKFLKTLGLRPRDLGVRNVDEQGQTILNQCFYLSLAHAYLGHELAENGAMGLALHLRRAIEAAVLASRPNLTEQLAKSAAGECPAMVFADFLPIAMKEQEGEEDANLLAKLAVCILDSVAGHVEVFLGPKYNDMGSRNDQVRNFLLLWYVPGHYQCVVCDDESGSKLPMTYCEFKELLVKHGVMYIETTE
eukprot:TRINITY_DN93343_c0_g1_i1.p1 TRINITY_DN93343_c0_g1~~TRINITY_DN93343_c0_g1_i1.p1  ORF type:complete len:340 (+),score=61.92 TRINITY_DN93343_c0_g1_i1:31-1050(+)